MDRLQVVASDSEQVLDCTVDRKKALDLRR